MKKHFLAAIACLICVQAPAKAQVLSSQDYDFLSIFRQSQREFGLRPWGENTFTPELLNQSSVVLANGNCFMLRNGTTVDTLLQRISDSDQAQQEKLRSAILLASAVIVYCPEFSNQLDESDTGD